MVNYSKPLPFLFPVTHSNKLLNKNYVVVVVVFFFLQSSRLLEIEYSVN